jgi:hypothetical protein
MENQDEHHVKIVAEGEVKRKMNRTLTQRYDMSQIKKLQSLEEKYMEHIAQLYGVDKDDLNIDLDILAIFNIINDNEKRTKLEECLKDSPSSPEELISKLLEEMTHIHNELISDK